MNASELVRPKSTIPGSLENVQTVVSLAAKWAKHINQDCRPFVAQCRKLLDVRAWEVFFTEGEKSWERLCAEGLKLDARFVAKILEGVEILEGKGDDRPTRSAGHIVGPPSAAEATEGERAQKIANLFQRLFPDPDENNLLAEAEAGDAKPPPSSPYPKNADAHEIIRVPYQRIYYDWAVADGTYTPEQLRKAKMVVKPWGSVQTYALELAMQARLAPQ